MLNQLQIRNFAIIDTIELELSDGMTVLTGETGAGKSILIDAIGLVLGDRAGSDTVRPGTKRAEICASFNIDTIDAAKQWLIDHDLDDEGQCFLRRIVATEGKSRGYINSRPVSMQTLRTLGEMLVDIHGQHEHYTLSRRPTQRTLLDRTLPNDTLLNQVAESFERWSTLNEQIQSLARETDIRKQQADTLRFQLQEFKSLSLNAEELAEIENEFQRAANAGRLLELTKRALINLDSVDTGAGALLQSTVNQLEQLNAIDPSLKDCLEIVNTASILTQEASTSLRNYLNSTDIDENRLQFLDDRLSQLHPLAKKHHCDLTDLLDKQQELEAQLEQVEISDDDLEQMQRECDARLEIYHSHAKKLTRQRQKAAKKLADSVTRCMQSLGMQDGEFLVELNTDVQQLNKIGHDSAQFLVSPNPGMRAGEISRIASGGELSRISLALALVTREAVSRTILVFDEVDAGIGGAVATTVGDYLRQLSDKTQILCVTHLAQVAAQANHHLRVEKEVVADQTRTLITPLRGDDMVDEIARMIGGAKLTKKSRQHAREMLTGAG